MEKNKKYILWFKEITKEDVPIVGGKNANLGEMYQNLISAKNATFTDETIQVPYGFAVTAAAYNYFISANELDKKIKDVLDKLDTDNIHALEKAGQKVRDLIISAKFPQDLEEQILNSYTELAKELNLDLSDLDVAVRSSATAEDLPSASFAGQQETWGARASPTSSSFANGP